jgi:hypothetical protein
MVRTKVVLPFRSFEWKMTAAGDGAMAGFCCLSRKAGKHSGGF